jgi:hypothetical protein
MSKDAAELTPELQEAQSTLEGALREACGVDVKKANTGELIHVDELLAIAGGVREESDHHAPPDAPGQERH